MRKKLSVIIPIYNTEKYLKSCLDSIINQTYKNLEIILIDDGSTDLSKSICLEYIKKDCRIKLICQKNRGIGEVRNLGIKISTGEFIAFVDSDDTIDNLMFEKMMEFCQEYELVICGISYIINTVKIREYIPHEISFSEICKYSFPCNKIFKKTLFNGINFPNDKIFEDFYTIPKIYTKCNKIKIISESFYNYYQREDSISHKRDKLNMFDLLKAYKEIEDYLIKNRLTLFLNEFLKLKKDLKKYFLYKYFPLQGFLFKLKTYKILKEDLKKLKLWNSIDICNYIYGLIYPRYYIKKIYYILKKVI